MSFSDLPYIDTRHEKHECSANCRCPKSCIKAAVEQDTRLKKWDTWMKERRRVQDKLAKATNRGEPELLMNTIEGRREDLEDKTILEYSRIPGPLDYYRGSPAFWRMPTALTNRCGEPQTYYTVLTKPEKFEVPDIEYVRTPEVIQQEKASFSNRKLCGLNKSQYFHDSYKSGEVKRIEPHHPNIAKLAVVGESLHKAPVEEEETLVHKYSAIEHVSIGITNDCFMELNDLKLYQSSSGVRKTTIFINGVTCGNVETAHLRINNLHKLSVRFFFVKKEECKQLSELIGSTCPSRAFYYNKNVQLLEPGRVRNFPFWFKTYTYKPFQETIQMILQPDFWFGSLHILVVLQASVNRLTFNMRCSEITQNLENQIRDRLIKEALDSILKNVRDKRAEAKIFTYDRAMIFEAVNSAYDPMRLLPRYLYDKLVVDELEQFYEDVKLEVHPRNWDYQLETLRTVTKDRMNAQEEVKLIEQLETLRAKVVACEVKRAELEAKAEAFFVVGGKKGPEKVKPEKPAKDKEEKKGKKDVAGTMVERHRDVLPKTLVDDLDDIIAKLKTPMTWKFHHLRRTQMCYTLFCAYIDRICSEALELESLFKIERLLPMERQHVHGGKERIYDEKLTDVVMECPKITEFIGSASDKQAPDWTSKIPIEDHERRYNAFHGIDAKSKDQKAKGKKASIEKGGVKSSASKRSSRSKNAIKIDETILGGPPIPDKITEIPIQSRAHYKNNLYAIFKVNLEKLVDDIVGVFELLPRPEIPREVLKTIRESMHEKLRVNTDAEVRVFDLKRAISELLTGDEPTVKYADTKFVRADKPDITESCSSVWELLQSYYPAKERTAPLKEGGVYGIRQKGYTPELVDAATSVTEESIVLDKNLQTNICGSKTVVLSDPHVNDERKVCTCEHPEVSESISSYYDSVISFSNLPSLSSDEVKSCKES